MTLPLQPPTDLHVPAVHCYYRGSNSDEYPPTVNQSASLRRVLSSTFSRVFLLLPHAIPRSFLDRKPVWEYHDHLAYRNAAYLYNDPNETPVTDLMDSFRSIHQGWIDHWSTLKPRL